MSRLKLDFHNILRKWSYLAADVVGLPHGKVAPFPDDLGSHRRDWNKIMKNVNLNFIRLSNYWNLNVGRIFVTFVGYPCQSRLLLDPLVLPRATLFQRLAGQPKGRSRSESMYLNFEGRRGWKKSGAKSFSRQHINVWPACPPDRYGIRQVYFQGYFSGSAKRR